MVQKSLKNPLLQGQQGDFCDMSIISFFLISQGIGQV